MSSSGYVAQAEHRLQEFCVQNNLNYDELFKLLITKYSSDAESEEDDNMTTVSSGSKRRRVDSNEVNETKKKRTECFIQTQNSFEGLQDLSEGIERSATDKKTRSKKVPPIVIPQIDTKKLSEALKKDKNIKYNVKITKNNRKIISCDSNENHAKMFNFLRTNNVEAHTYTNNEEKQTILLMKGVQHTFSCQEIMEELQSILNTKIQVKELETNRSRKEGYRINAHIVAFDRNVNIKELTNIKYICYHKIKWERLRKKDLIQCMRCQRVGHVAKNCTYQYRCVKCEKIHNPGECKRTDRKEDPYCVNCKKYGHPANYRGCEEIKKAENTVRSMRAKKEQVRMQKPSGETTTLKAASIIPTLSFADVLRMDKLTTTNETEEKNRNVSTLNFKTFATEESKELFGCDLITLMGKVNRFLPQYKKCQGRDEKQAAYLAFVFAICQG